MKHNVSKSRRTLVSHDHLFSQNIRTLYIKKSYINKIRVIQQQKLNGKLLGPLRSGCNCVVSHLYGDINRLCGCIISLLHVYLSVSVHKELKNTTCIMHLVLVFSLCVFQWGREGQFVHASQLQKLKYLQLIFGNIGSKREGLMEPYAIFVTVCCLINTLENTFFDIEPPI